MHPSMPATAAAPRNGAGGEQQPRRCAACKFLRRRCEPDCVLSPFFPASDPRRYAFVQRLFGAGNAARLLQQLPANVRRDAAEAMAEEARRREEDPVYGCAGVISRLQDEISAVQCELARTQAQVAIHRAAATADAAAHDAQVLAPPRRWEQQQQQLDDVQ